MVRRSFLLLGIVAASCGAWAQLTVNTLPPDLAQKVDQVAEQALEQTGVPSASLALVRGGQIAYTRITGRKTT